jgi:methyl-accepting chemotaxis protein
MVGVEMEDKLIEKINALEGLVITVAKYMKAIDNYVKNVEERVDLLSKLIEKQKKDFEDTLKELEEINKKLNEMFLIPKKKDINYIG